MALTFSAKLEKVPTEGGWHIVQIPSDILGKLRDEAGKNGNVPVYVEVGRTTWPSTTMSMGEQRWFVAVKADVRQAENIVEGDIVSVKITPDFERLKK